MHEPYLYEVSIYNRLDNLTADNCILVRFQLGQLFGCKTIHGYVILTHHIKPRRNGGRLLSLLWFGKHSPKSSKDSTLCLTAKKRKVVLKVKRENNLTSQSRILQKLELRAPKIGIALTSDDDSLRRKDVPCFLLDANGALTLINRRSSISLNSYE